MAGVLHHSRTSLYPICIGKTGFLGRQTAQNRLQARNGLRVKAFLRSGPPLCDLENTHFRSLFWLDIGISQTKSGPSLLTLWDWRGEGQWGSSTLAKW